jgi:hypothetical protein
MRPLDGIKVITLEHAIAAPFCTRQLADLGARVIKVERPGVGDFARAYDERVRGLASHFVWTNRRRKAWRWMSSARRPSASWSSCWKAPTFAARAGSATVERSTGCLIERPLIWSAPILAFFGRIIPPNCHSC